jgi:phosphomevalonate kinase
MNMQIAASAPGKLVLSGEYAVLDGAPAICLAVDRRARVTVERHDGEISTVRAPGHTQITGRFDVRQGGVRWKDGAEAFALVDAVLRISNVSKSEALTIELDTRDFVDSATDQKLGIGSSAAATVALCAALLETDDRVSILNAARRAHAELQGGVGSGVDIACSLYGGLIAYRTEGSVATGVAWPQGLCYRFVWSGVAASTRDRLRQLDSAVSRPSRVRLASAAEDIADAWQSGSAEAVLSGYRNYTERLREFSEEHDLGIFDSGHDEVWREASSRGFIYKPCGAGGGDVGVLLGEDETELESLLGTLPPAYSTFDCRKSDAGLSLQCRSPESA